MWGEDHPEPALPCGLRLASQDDQHFSVLHQVEAAGLEQGWQAAGFGQGGALRT